MLGLIHSLAVGKTKNKQTPHATLLAQLPLNALSDTFTATLLGPCMNFLGISRFKLAHESY